MNIELTGLIISQLKTIGTMMAAGIIMAALWSAKRLLLVKTDKYIKRKKAFCVFSEFIYWLAAAFILPMFLYYCTYGKITFCAVLGTVFGLVLWGIFNKKNFK